MTEDVRDQSAVMAVTCFLLALVLVLVVLADNALNEGRLLAWLDGGWR